MSLDLNKPIYFERTVKIEVTPQARKVLSKTGYSEEDLVNEYVSKTGFSIGGHNVIIFLEKKVSKGE